MQQSKGYLFLLIVVALAVGSAFLYRSQPYRLGLDVQGGVRFTYEMNLDELPADREESDAAIQAKLVKILERRASAALGVQEGTVQAKGTQEIIIELPGYTDPEQAREVMSNTAKLQMFWARNVTTDRETFRTYTDLRPEVIDGGPVIGFTRRNGEETIYPSDPEYQEMIQGWQLILEGQDLSRAEARPFGDRLQPFFFFGREGEAKLRSWSGRYVNRGEKIAFVLDGTVLSIAPIKDGVILSDQAFIDGEFETSYVTGLVELLNAGALPVGLTETSVQSVDATLGKSALNMMLRAGAISLGFVALFLVVYYVFPGFVALIALLLYILFTLTALKLIGATFSLASIAGVILSITMAVDANILVFERLKEEMRDGRPLTSAVNLGFKRALTAIVDSSAATIITSLVLINFGTGPVKGFASTLVMGVVISLFTALTVTRSLLVFLVSSGIGTNPKWYGLSRQWFGEGLEKDANAKPLQIVDKWRRWFILSGLAILPGVVFIAMGGLKPNVEFQGGYSVGVREGQNAISAEQISTNLDQAGFDGHRVRVASTDQDRIAYIDMPRQASITDEQGAGAQIAEAAGFTGDDVVSFDYVGPSIQAETIRHAVLGVVISSTLILLYLTIRFGIALGGLKNGFKFGMSAILALLHDVLVVLGVMAFMGVFFNWPISSLFVTSMLTVIGFSVHDTIVVFDRIRENLRRPVKGEDFANLCNRSVTQSFARSINTSLTTIFSLAVLIGFGTATTELKSFCLAMLIGIISGTFSSIYNAAPILYLWDRATIKRRGEEHGLLAEAQREVQRARAASLGVEVGRPTGAPSETASPERGYSQTKRRTSAVQKSMQSVDEDDEK